MKLVTKKSPRGRLFRELSSEESTAIGNVCGRGHVTSLAEKRGEAHNVTRWRVQYFDAVEPLHQPIAFFALRRVV